MDKEERTGLRSAIYRADGAEVVVALGPTVPEQYLQLVGDGLLTALAQDVPGAELLARSCVEQLRARGWDGDELLAVELEAALGQGSAPELRPLPVDLEELSDALEESLGADSGLLELQTGEVWSAPAVEYAVEEGELDVEDLDPKRWLEVPPEGSDEAYRDMLDFISSVADPGRADRLAIAVEGKGAFRRFKDVLARWEDEEDRWYRFSEERRRGRARAWLAGVGYRRSVATETRAAP